MKQEFFREIREKETNLTREEEKQLILQAQSGCTISRDKIIFAHARFAVSEAKKQTNFYHEDDLIQCAMIGLNEAIDNFNTTKKVKFISYAVFHIKKYISDYWAKNKTTIRIPAIPSEGHIYASSFSYDSIEEGLSDSIFSNYTEILTDLDLEKKEKEKEKKIDALISFLPNKAQKIIKLRLFNNELTWEQIAKENKCTSSNARFIWNNFLKEMKEKYTKEEFINFFD